MIGGIPRCVYSERDSTTARLCIHLSRELHGSCASIVETVCAMDGCALPDSKLATLAGTRVPVKPGYSCRSPDRDERACVPPPGGPQRSYPVHKHHSRSLQWRSLVVLHARHDDGTLPRSARRAAARTAVRFGVPAEWDVRRPHRRCSAAALLHSPRTASPHHDDPSCVPANLPHLIHIADSCGPAYLVGPSVLSPTRPWTPRRWLARRKCVCECGHSCCHSGGMTRSWI